MNEYSLSPLLPGSNISLSTEHPGWPMRRTDIKTFCFQLRYISSWKLVAFPWLSRESPGFLFVANQPSQPAPKEHIPQPEGTASRGFLTRRDWAAGWCHGSDHRLNMPYFAFCLLRSTPGGHAPEAGNGTSPLTLSSSNKQPHRPPLKGLGWILESSPHIPTPPATSCLYVAFAHF